MFDYILKRRDMAIKRVFTWMAVVAAAFLCALGGQYVYGTIINYNFLQNDVYRQLDEVNVLKTQLNENQVQLTDARTASETVTFLSTQIAGHNLSQQSLLSEKGELDARGWDEWRIEAVCTGTVGDLNAFIDALETSETYHGMKFTVDTDDKRLYELNIELRFYARHV